MNNKEFESSLLDNISKIKEHLLELSILHQQFTKLDFNDDRDYFQRKQLLEYFEERVEDINLETYFIDVIQKHALYLEDLAYDQDQEYDCLGTVDFEKLDQEIEIKKQLYRDQFQKTFTPSKNDLEELQEAMAILENEDEAL